jgi:hypothetical protein
VYSWSQPLKEVSVAVTPESLTELILEAQKSYDDVQKEIDSLNEQLEKLAKQRTELQLERDAFVNSLERRFPEFPVPIPNVRARIGSITLTVIPKDDWSYLNRSEAVERAVQELTLQEDFATPARIQELLGTRNRDDSRDAIGASLAYLNRTNKVHSPARAQWIAGAQD